MSNPIPLTARMSIVQHVESIADLRSKDMVGFVSGAKLWSPVRVAVAGYLSGDTTGHGEFLWNPLSTAADDGATVIAPSGLAVGRFERQFSGAIDATACGAKGDGRIVRVSVTGTACTATSDVFTSADVGKLINVDNCPTNKGSGTITVTGGNVVGVGTHLLTEFEDFDLILINGVPQILFSRSDDTHGVLLDITISTAPGISYYRGVRLATTIAAYTDARHVTLAAAAAAPAANQDACICTDDTAALQRMLDVAKAQNLACYLPHGMYGTLSNLGVTGASRMCVYGDGIDVTVIRDMRDWASNNLPDGAYYGIFSFVTTPVVSVFDLTIRGTGLEPVGAAMTDHTINPVRKAIYLLQYSTFIMRGVKAQNMRDEAFFGSASGANGQYADMQFNIAENCNTNAFNLGTGLIPVVGSKLNCSYNQVNNCGGLAFSNGAEACVQNGNVVMWNKSYPNGTQKVLLFAQNNNNFIGNTFVGFNASNSGAGVITCEQPSGAATDVVTNILGNTFIRCVGQNEAPNNGLINMTGVGGSWKIADNTFAQCGFTFAAFAFDCRFVSVKGNLTGQGYIQGNHFINATGYAMRVGVDVDATVPAGNVTIGENTYVNVPTPWALGAGIAQPSCRLTVTATGTTVVAAGITSVYVTFNGPVTVQLPSPALVGAGAKMTVSNGHLQAGTTTMTTPTGAVRGTPTIAGVDKSSTVESDGTDWRLIASA